MIFHAIHLFGRPDTQLMSASTASTTGTEKVNISSWCSTDNRVSAFHMRTYRYAASAARRR